VKRITPGPERFFFHAVFIIYIFIFYILFCSKLTTISSSKEACSSNKNTSFQETPKSNILFDNGVPSTCQEVTGQLLYETNSNIEEEK